MLHKDIEAERQRFIEALIEYKKLKGHDITVVFDGVKGGEATESRTVTGGISVIYSALGETADAVIKRTLTQSKKYWIVISSDRDIQAHAWSSGSVPIDSEDFLKVLERKMTAYEYPDEEEDEEYVPRKKGTPRRLSKKEKAQKRALNKL